MTEPRLIKKYPNRRLYDTEISKYVTLDDIKKLVMDGVEFCVKDAKSDEDITRNILLQIIAEQEDEGQPIFSTDSLTQIIRFYGDAMQGAASDFMSQSLQMFVEQQQRFQEQVADAVAQSPVAAMNELTKRNLAMWREMQDNFFKAAQSFGTKPKSNKEGD
jgi:polyhydroxyalkanoate synthesis repressor PhaR